MSISLLTSSVTHRDKIAVVKKYVPQTLVSVVRGDEVTSRPEEKQSLIANNSLIANLSKYGSGIFINLSMS